MSGNGQGPTWKPSLVAARIAAAHGEEHLDKVQATLDLAREMLAPGKLNASLVSHNRISGRSYPWETSKASADRPKRVWYASVEDLVSGEGYTIYFACGLHRDEDGLRRQLSAQIGRGLANAAEIRLDAEALPLAATFLTEKLKANFGAMGKGGPASLNYLASYHANYS